MKQWLKNLAIAGATAGAVVLGAASASAVSFTVVIEKIELMPNGNSSDRFVIYNPSAGIGATATTTLDLLNANKTGATLPVAAPKSGTYNTMLVTFSDISVQAETATVSATQSLLASLGGAQGFGTELGRNVLVMGDAGTGGASIGTLLGGGITAIPMQPVVSNGATVTLPGFDFFLPASKVVTSGTGSVNVTSVPVAISVARTDVDAASVPNVTIGVKGNAFDGTSAITTSGNFAVKVGLFKSALDLKPVYVATATVVSNTAITDNSVTEVTFLDVADGTYLPLAWLDTDADGLLDDAEPFLMVDGDDTGVVTTDNNLVAGDDNEHFLTVNKSDIFGATATTTGVISTTSAAFNTSATTTGGSTTNVNTGAPLGTVFGDNATGFLGQSGNFRLFPARSISITLQTSAAASTTLSNDTDDCANCGLNVTWAGGDGVNATNALGVVSITVGSVVLPSLTVKLDDNDGSTDGGTVLNDGDVAELVVSGGADGVVSEIAGNSLITYSNDGAAAASLKLSPVPVTAITNLDRTSAYGTYSVTVAIQAQSTAGTSLGAIDSATISNADVAFASGDHTLATSLVNIGSGNSKTLTATLGN